MIVFQKKFVVTRCLCAGSVLLVLQCLVTLVLLYLLEKSENFSAKTQLISLYEDLRTITQISLHFGFHFIVLDSEYLMLINNPGKRSNFFESCSFTVLAIDQSIILEGWNKILERFTEEEFTPITFYNVNPKQIVPELIRVKTQIVLKRKATFLILVLYSREDSTWWFGDIRSDPVYELKLASINLTQQFIFNKQYEGAIDKFEVSLDEETNFLMPKDTDKFLLDIKSSQFIECNMTRAALFKKTFQVDRSSQASRFRHKVWKMLSRVKTVMETLGIVFWLSSGTLLGYFRECDIIAHSKDVDIGLWASSYSSEIITEMQNHGFHLKISLGFPNDSMELSFVDQSGVKLDMFFFYQEDNFYWNGGTQVKSGKKFKYIFPKFTLCWTLFKDLRVRVPCETEDFVGANYGPNWFTPVKSWDWKTSPFNVKPNGEWSSKQLSHAIKLYL